MNALTIVLVLVAGYAMGVACMCCIFMGRGD